MHPRQKHMLVKSMSFTLNFLLAAIVGIYVSVSRCQVNIIIQQNYSQPLVVENFRQVNKAEIPKEQVNRQLNKHLYATRYPSKESFNIE